MSDDIRLDIPDITVLIQPSEQYKTVTVQPDTQYNVNISIPASTTRVTGSYITFAESAITASYALRAQELVAGGTIEYANISASNNIIAGNSITAQTFIGNGAQITGVITASYALTASYVSGAASDWDSIANKPTGLVSSSAQVSTGSFTGSFTGSLLGTASYALSALSSSYAPLTLPAGLVSSSAQVNTGSFTGSFIGILVGTASWATAAITASHALTASYVSGAATTWDTISGKPSGLVSSSQQVNTGSFTGSFTGISSFALLAATASYISGTIQFTDGLDVTGSVVATGGFTGSLFGTASVAQRLPQIGVSVTTAITPSFNSITSGSQHLSDGTYAISATLFNNYRISGILSWTTGNCFTDYTDEVPLHRAGLHISNSLYIRTRAVSGSPMVLEIGSSTSIPSAQHSFVFTDIE